MTKKRVHELAKEMGLENKELISRLEKIGIAVKSHSSTLEDGDLERIQKELLAPEPREVVEKRIKSTVIRRRAVRVPVEESKPVEAAKAAKPEEAPAVEAVPKEAVREPAPKEVPVRTSIYRDVPAAEPPVKPASPRETAPKLVMPAAPAPPETPAEAGLGRAAGNRQQAPN